MTRKILIATFTLFVAVSTVPAQYQSPVAGSQQINQFSASDSKTVDVNLTGKWTLKVDAQGQQLEVMLNLAQNEKTFDGTLSSALGDGKVMNGSIKENEFSAKIQANIQGQDVEIQMSGKIDGEKMTGSFVLPNSDPVMFEGVKAKSN